MQDMLTAVQDSDASFRNAVYGVSSTVNGMVDTLKAHTYADPNQVHAQDHAWAVLQGRLDGRFNARTAVLLGKRDRRLFEGDADEDADKENVGNAAEQAAARAESYTANDFDKFLEDYKYMYRTCMGVIRRFQGAWGDAK